MPDIFAALGRLGFLDSWTVQAAAGIVPFVLALAVMAVFSKKRRSRNIAAGAVGLAVAGLAVAFGMLFPDIAGTGGADGGFGADVPEPDRLRFAYALADAGEPELAAEAVKDARGASVYAPRAALALARIATIQGRTEAAKALYRKTGMTSPETPEAVRLMISEAVAAPTPTVMDGGPSGSGGTGGPDDPDGSGDPSESSDAGGSDDPDGSSDPSDAGGPDGSSDPGDPSESSDAGGPDDAGGDGSDMEGRERDANNYENAANAVAYAKAQYETYLKQGYADVEEANRYLKRIEDAVEETPELAKLEPLRTAGLKLRLLREDFRGIAGNVGPFSDHNELLIVSELYMNGYVKPSQFSEAYAGEAEEQDYSEVISALEDVYANEYAGKARAERESARELIGSLERYLENPALIKITGSLLDYAESERGADRSKAYMQLAKAEAYLGNGDRSTDYLDRSLNTVGDCEDTEYTAPMYEIIGIIADKDDPERLKDVASYTDRILTNTMTVQMADELRGPAPAGYGESGGSSGDGSSGGGSSGDGSSYDGSGSGSDGSGGIFGGSSGGASSSSGGDGSSGDASSGGAGGSQAGDATLSGPEAAARFSSAFNTYVSQKRMAIAIVGVDASGFDTVEANINISGDMSYTVDELKAMLEVSDCDIDIESFELEKVDYSGANILLCADISGSMQGQPIADLRSAVQMFVESSDAIESVALVTFNSGVVSVHGFGTPQDELVAAAQGLYDGGGTNMYGAVQEALAYFTPSLDEINCVILISDGEDNTPAYAQEIEDNVGAPYRAKGVTLYALGLGSGAAGEYLNALAGSTGGKYVFASDSVEIQSFFDGVRAQILNSYRLSYRAEDTIQASRNLRVALAGESYVYDEYWYSIGGDGAGEGGGEGDAGVIYLEGKAVYGFEEKLLYKSDRSRRLNFKGTGFEQSDELSVSLSGHIDYDRLAVEFVDEGTYSVVVPAGVACDAYDVRVSLNGKRTVLENGLTVAVQGSEKRTEFGDYVFTSFFAQTENGQTTLSQYVTMNGWLGFKGDVTLAGDLEGESVVLGTDRQAFVHYYADTAEGLARAFAGRDVPIPALPEVTLYNQHLFAGSSGGSTGAGGMGGSDGSGGELRVEPVPIPGLRISGFMTLATPGLSMYPDRLELASDSFTTDLPFQDQILKGVGLFTFETSVAGSIGAKSIDLAAEITAGAGDRDGIAAKNPINMGNIPLFVNTDELELRLDTREGEFYVKYVAALPFIGDTAGFGASLGWKWGDGAQAGPTNIYVDEFMLYADVDIPLKGSPIDLTFSDFKAGFQGMTDSNPMIVGGFDASAYKLGTALPGIGKYLGSLADASLLSADDAEIRVGLQSFYIKASTTIKFLGAIELGGVSAELGKFEYTNKLLGLENEEVTGFTARVTAGPAIHMDNCDIALQGSLEATGTNRFGGLGVTGNVDLAVKWWIFQEDFHAQGQALIGVQFTHDGDTVFLAKASDGRKVFFIQWSKRRGGDVGSTDL